MYESTGWLQNAIDSTKFQNLFQMTALLESIQENLEGTRHLIRVELGWYEEVAAEILALVVFVSDGLLQVTGGKETTSPARFFKIAKSLPLELQVILCLRAVGSLRELIHGRQTEVAFKQLAQKFIFLG